MVKEKGNRWNEQGNKDDRWEGYEMRINDEKLLLKDKSENSESGCRRGREEMYLTASGAKHTRIDIKSTRRENRPVETGSTGLTSEDGQSARTSQ
jgi:hypothetical protein